MANPFEASSNLAAPPAEKPQKDRVKIARLTFEEDKGAYRLRFEFPAAADWRTIMAYQRALEFLTDERYGLFGRSPTLTLETENKYSVNLSKRDFKPGEIEALIPRFPETLKTESLHDWMESDEREIEARLKVEAAYPVKKKKFLTALLAAQNQPTADLELPIELDLGLNRFRFSAAPDDLVGQIIQGVVQEFESEGKIDSSGYSNTIDAVLGKLFKLKFQEFNLDDAYNRNDATREKLRQEITTAIMGRFKDLLKNGPGRNKIKYELKKMEPGYAPQNKV
jgi:hypothetical protein